MLGKLLVINNLIKRGILQIFMLLNVEHMVVIYYIFHVDPFKIENCEMWNNACVAGGVN